jgi:hypothetical protein
MDKFTPEEKKELLKAAHSKELREEFRHIASNRADLAGRDGGLDLDSIIKFVQSCNVLANHAPKPFKKITGNNFKM